MQIDVSLADVATSRFAISPLVETVSALRLLAGQCPAGALLPWARRMAPRYSSLRRSEPAVGALLSLFRRRAYNADFTQPPPAGVGLTFAEEIAAVRATPLAQARQELARNLAGHRTPPGYARRIFESPQVVGRLADAIECAWTTLVEPDWPRLRAILERDIVQRAGQLAAYGWAAALAELSPRVSWVSDGRRGTIEIRDHTPGRYPLNGRGLLLVPTVFGTLISYVEPPWPCAIVYRARGVAELFGPPPTSRPPDSVDRLIGSSRAALLRALSVPATTTQLVAQLGISLGSVGGHLAVLREAQLVVRTRVGRSVRYQRTPLGDALATDLLNHRTR